MAENEKTPENDEKEKMREAKAQEVITRLNAAGDMNVKVEKHAVRGVYDVIEGDGKKSHLFINGQNGDVYTFGENAQNLKANIEKGGKVENTDNGSLRVSVLKESFVTKIRDREDLTLEEKSLLITRIEEMQGSDERIIEGCQRISEEKGSGNGNGGNEGQGQEPQGDAAKKKPSGIQGLAAEFAGNENQESTSKPLYTPDQIKFIRDALDAKGRTPVKPPFIK